MSRQPGKQEDQPEGPTKEQLEAAAKAGGLLGAVLSGEEAKKLAEERRARAAAGQGQGAAPGHRRNASSVPVGGAPARKDSAEAGAGDVKAKAPAPKAQADEPTVPTPGEGDAPAEGEAATPQPVDISLLKAFALKKLLAGYAKNPDACTDEVIRKFLREQVLSKARVTQAPNFASEVKPAVTEIFTFMKALRDSAIQAEAANRYEGLRNLLFAQVRTLAAQTDKIGQATAIAVALPSIVVSAEDPTVGLKALRDATAENQPLRAAMEIAGISKAFAASYVQINQQFKTKEAEAKAKEAAHQTPGGPEEGSATSFSTSSAQPQQPPAQVAAGSQKDKPSAVPAAGPSPGPELRSTTQSQAGGGSSLLSSVVFEPGSNPALMSVRHSAEPSVPGASLQAVARPKADSLSQSQAAQPVIGGGQKQPGAADNKKKAGGNGQSAGPESNASVSSLVTSSTLNKSLAVGVTEPGPGPGSSSQRPSAAGLGSLSSSRASAPVRRVEERPGPSLTVGGGSSGAGPRAQAGGGDRKQRDGGGRMDAGIESSMPRSDTRAGQRGVLGGDSQYKFTTSMSFASFAPGVGIVMSMAPAGSEEKQAKAEKLWQIALKAFTLVGDEKTFTLLYNVREVVQSQLLAVQAQILGEKLPPVKKLSLPGNLAALGTELSGEMKAATYEMGFENIETLANIIEYFDDATSGNAQLAQVAEHSSEHQLGLESKTYGLLYPTFVEMPGSTQVSYSLQKSDDAKAERQIHQRYTDKSGTVTSKPATLKLADYPTIAIHWLKLTQMLYKKVSQLASQGDFVNAARIAYAISLAISTAPKGDMETRYQVLKAACAKPKAGQDTASAVRAAFGDESTGDEQYELDSERESDKALIEVDALIAQIDKEKGQYEAAQAARAAEEAQRQAELAVRSTAPRHDRERGAAAGEMDGEGEKYYESESVLTVDDDHTYATQPSVRSSAGAGGKPDSRTLAAFFNFGGGGGGRDSKKKSGKNADQGREMQSMGVSRPSGSGGGGARRHAADVAEDEGQYTGFAPLPSAHSDDDFSTQYVHYQGQDDGGYTAAPSRSHNESSSSSATSSSSVHHSVAPHTGGRGGPAFGYASHGQPRTTGPGARPSAGPGPGQQDDNQNLGGGGRGFGYRRDSLED